MRQTTVSLWSYIFTRSKTFQVPLSDEIEHYSLGNESIERSFTDERFWLYVFSGNDLAGSILPSPLQSRGIGSAIQCPKETSFVCFHPTCQEAILKRVVWPPWKEIRQLLTHSLLFSIKNLPKGNNNAIQRNVFCVCVSHTINYVSKNDEEKQSKDMRSLDQKFPS